VGSTVTVRGEDPAGLTTLPDGRLLRDAIAQDAAGWLGEPHVRAFGDDPMLLVKVLDAGQRLPIHAHPDGTFAAREVGSRHGKAEAWYILTPGSVHLGLTQDIARSTAFDLVQRQQMEDLLPLMHVVAVQQGDTVYVPPGMLHAIGEGVLLVELQEPEDLSILLEWKGFGIDGSEHGHLGVGFETAIEAVRLTRDSSDDIDRLVVRASSRPGVLAGDAARYFRLEEFDVDGRQDIDGGFAIVVGLEGDVELFGEGGAVQVGQGATAVLPAAAGAPALVGRGKVLVARPPLPAG
jgi:mannose-6-phosphate isomerase